MASVKAVYAALKRLLDAFEPDVVLTPNFASMIQDVARLLALRRGVKMVGVFYTKISGRFAFTYSPHVADGPFIERVDALNAGALSPHEAEARAYVEGFCEAFLAPKPAAARPPLRRRLLAEAMPYLLIGRYYQKKLLGKEERRANLGITLDHRPPRIVLRDHYQHKRNRRRALRYPYTPLEGLGPYAYFPLQFQPEAQIDVISPYFSNQIEVARLAAQALPGDLVLAVKEHPSMVGRRGRSYYDKLARSPNVKLIDCRVPSGQVIRGARLVLSPSSTTISEAAFFRVPAIQFGDMGITLKLPNVVKHTDMTTLSARVREALACDLHGEDYDRRLRNYVAAAYDVGFELPYVRMWERGGDEAELEALWRC